MSFNIRLNVESDGENAWPHRTDIVESMIRFHQVDILGVQEAKPEQMVDLSIMLHDYEAVGEPRDSSDWGEYSAIWFSKQRFALVETETFWLSETPEFPGKGWDAAMNRICTWAKLRDLDSGYEFIVMNTHFDHVGVQARLESSKLIKAQAEGLSMGKLPLILVGDLNSTPDSEAYKHITLSSSTFSLQDAFQISRLPSHGPKSSWSGFKEAGVPGRRIDYIFVSPGIEVLRHGILSESWSGRFPSDHLPVFAEIRIP